MLSFKYVLSLLLFLLLLLLPNDCQCDQSRKATTASAPPRYPLLLCVVAESAEVFDALSAFFSNHIDEASCSNAASWSNWLGANPSTFCDTNDTPTRSTFDGITCDGFNGDITHVEIADCGFTGPLPASFSALKSKLQVMDLGSNQFTGSLPSEWSSWTSITTLILKNNQLSGSVPVSWATAMTKLEVLDIQVNQLSGTLPNEWASLTQLHELYANQNQFRGTLPSQWGSQWTSPRTVYLNNNELNGTLPASYGAWSSMTTLYLQYNRLSGTLPHEWVGMQSMQILSLKANALTGTVPSGWPRGMTSLLMTGAYCRVVCRGVVGVNDSCQTIYSGPQNCSRFELQYNCLTLTNLPPINSSYRWNWRSTNLNMTPQRSPSSCPPVIKEDASPSGTHSFTLLDSSSIAHSVSNTMSVTTTAYSPSRSVTHGSFTTGPSQSLSMTLNVTSSTVTVSDSSTRKQGGSLTLTSTVTGTDRSWTQSNLLSSWSWSKSASFTESKTRTRTLSQPSGSRSPTDRGRVEHVGLGRRLSAGRRIARRGPWRVGGASSIDILRLSTG